jgi:hypothetical protein
LHQFISGFPHRGVLATPLSPERINRNESAGWSGIFDAKAVRAYFEAGKDRVSAAWHAADAGGIELRIGL